MAERMKAVARDSLGAVAGMTRLGWLKDGASSFVEKHPTLCWLGACGVTSCMLVRMYRNRPLRVPHPNKTVAEGQPEVIIVGSGITGSSLAAVLGKDGRRVTVIEREMKEPDRFVGEFMQPGGVVALKKLQLEECLEGIESPHYRGYIFWDMENDRSQVLTFREECVGGRAFHHGRFVQKLRKAAKAEDTVTYVEGVVMEVLEEGGAVVGVRYRPKHADTEEKCVQVLKAPLVVIADGIYSKFRKDYTKDPPDPQGGFCGLMMHNVEQGLYKHLELVLAEPSFVIVYKVSPGLTRALVDLPLYYAEMPTDMRAYLKDVVYPKMPAHLAGPFLEAVEEGNYRKALLKYLPANPVFKPGVIVLGDALNVRHALTAGGMTAGLNDAILARAMLRKVPDLYNYSTVMNLYRRMMVDRKERTFSINVFTFVLYHVFVTTDYHMKKVKKGMFEYFDSPGFRKDAAIGIFSILDHQPHTLLLHLFLSVQFAIWVNVRNEGILRFPLSLYQGVLMFIKSVGLLSPYVWGEIKPLL